MSQADGWTAGQPDVPDIPDIPDVPGLPPAAFPAPAFPAPYIPAPYAPAPYAPAPYIPAPAMPRTGDASREPAWWTWRAHGPKSVALRVGTAAAVAVVAAQVHQHDDPGVLCPFRRITGIPCPFCGSTTVFMEAGAGHVGAAVTANPFTVVAALGFLLLPLVRTDLPKQFARLPKTTRWVVGGVLLCASWLWQLHRFNLL